MKKIICIVCLILFLAIFIFYNVGKWIDVTVEPKKSDLIVCLGGGTVERIQKSIQLYKRGYSTKNILFLLGENNTNLAYIRRNNLDINYVEDERPRNTAEEIEQTKIYMIKNNYKSVIIVSDPPHTRRIKILTELIFLNGDETFSYTFVSSNVRWWDQKLYFKNKRALHVVWSEVLKTIYVYFYYGIIFKLGLEYSDNQYNDVRKKFENLIKLL